MGDTECYVSCAVCSANFGRMVLIGPTETSGDLGAEVLKHALDVHGAEHRPSFARMWLNNKVRAVTEAS